MEGSALRGQLLRRRPAGRPLRFLFTCGGVVGGATVVGTAIAVEPLVAVAVPSALASALLCSRLPAAAVFMLLVLSGGFGSLQAFLSVPAAALADVLIAGLWIGAILSQVIRGRERVALLWPGVAAAIVYLLVTTLQILGSESLSVGLYGYRATAWYMATLLLVGYAAWHVATEDRIARAVLVSAALVGGYATLRWVIGPADSELRLLNETFAGRYSYIGDDLAVFGSFTSRHLLGAWTAAVIPFCVAFALTFRGVWRFVAIASGALCTLGLFASQTRIAALGAVCGALLTLVLYQLARGFPGLHIAKTAATVLATASICGVAFALATAGDEELVKRYTTITDPSRDPSYVYRAYKWENAMREVRGLPFGQGLGTGLQSSNVPRRFVTLADIRFDSSYLKIAFEQGLVVMIFFVVTLLLLLGGLARRAVWALDRRRAGLAIGACGTLLSFAITLTAGVYVSGLESLVAWVIVGLGVAQFAFLDRSPAAEPNM